MSEVNIPPFYVGQKVVCVEPLMGLLVKGKHYVIKFIYKYKCCGIWMACWEGGKANQSPITRCHNCDTIHDASGIPSDMALASRFRSIQENFQSITLEKILEQETKLVGAN